MKKKLIILRSVSGHVSCYALGYKFVHEWHGFGGRTQEGEQMLEL